MINEIVYHERRKCIYTLPSFYKRELYIRVKHNDKQSHLSFVYKFLLICLVNCPFLLLF